MCASQSSRTLFMLATARVLVLYETLAQPDFAVVNCSDVVMSAYYFPVSTRSLILLQL